MSYARRCPTPEETRRAGAELVPCLARGDVVTLVGPLGAGKTTFVQGLARGLGVTERVTSPTFTLVREHRCGPGAPVRVLHHADLYRIESADEALDLALGELVEEDAIAVVEWGELAPVAPGGATLTVTIARGPDDVRLVTVDGPLAAVRADALQRWAGA